MLGVAPTTAHVAKSNHPSSPSSEEMRRAVCAARTAGEEGSSVALACETSVEGVLSSVGVGYLAHLPSDRIRLTPANLCQPRLAEVTIAAPSPVDDAVIRLARRVWQGLEGAVSERCRRQRDGRCSAHCGSECMRKVLLACASDSSDMPEVVHRYVRLGFDVRGNIRSMSTSPEVRATDALARRVSCECEKTRQFVRFSRLSDGSFFSVFRPNENTVPLVAQHFVARLGTDRFFLVDPVHRVAALHEAGASGSRMVRLDQVLADELASRDDLAQDERYVRAMWKRLYDGITIEGRGKAERGYDLRMHWMPKRFWEGLPELDPRSDEAGDHVPERYASTNPGALPEGDDKRLDA